jgi:hypothetical protein
MKKYLLFFGSFFLGQICRAATVNDVTVMGKVIVNEIHASTIGKTVSIWFLDGTTLTASGFSNQSASDNLGSHIATKTVTTPFGIVTSSMVSIGTVTAYGGFFSTAGALLGGTTVQGVFLLEGGSWQFRNGTNEFTIVFATRPQSAGQKIGVLDIVGNRVTLGGVGDQSGSGGGSGENWGNISTRNVDMNDFGIANSTGLELGNFLQLTTFLSTVSQAISDLSISSTIIFNQESPDISNRTYYLHNESSGGLNSYYLILSSPSNQAGTAKAKAVASADGLVMVSSHVTLTNDPGVRKIPAGMWSFASFVDVSGVTGITQMVISVSTIGFGGDNETEIVSSTSPDIDDLGQGTRIDQIAVQQDDVAMSTSDRISVRYFVRTTNALGITFDFFYGGTSSASHLNTPIGNVYKLTQLTDTPQTLVGQRYKVLAVNDEEVTTVFISTVVTTTNTVTDFNQNAIVRFSTGVNNGNPFAQWDTPSPREFSWNGASLLAVSTPNSPNIPPVVQTTGTLTSVVMGASYDDTIEECRGSSFRIPRYANRFSSPTFTATWFSSSKSGATGNVIWDIKYSSGIMDAHSWDVRRTTVTADVSAATAGANKVAEVSWQPGGIGNAGRVGHGTLSSMAWDPGELVFFNVCREGANAADSLVGDAVLLDFTISIPMQ